MNIKTMLMAATICAASLLTAEDKPVALCGFKTDVKGIEEEVMKPGRYEYERFYDQWIDAADYPKYSVLYFGEKMSGKAKGKSFKPGENDEGRKALNDFIDAGGTVIVGGEHCMRQLFGWPNRKNPDQLRAKVVNITNLVGRTKANYAKAGKKLGEADDAGNFVTTDEGENVKRIVRLYTDAFAAVKGVSKIKPEGKWDSKPLGTPGKLVHETKFPKRAEFRRPPVRQPGLALCKDGRKAVIVVPPDQKKGCQKLADELAWHLEQMCGEKFDIVDAEPKEGAALVYRTVRPSEDYTGGKYAYMKIWREGDRVYLGGEDTGKSRATTYVLEALGCRYLWPGEGGKIIPKAKEIVLPEIALEAGTSFAVRRMRLYGCPEYRDRPENRDFYRWYGLNDAKTMTSDKPGDADTYQWGHYYKDFYPKYYKEHRDWFALQPDGSRTLHLGDHKERPTFCLSNPELAAKTAERVKEFIAKHPEKKAVSLCLPDGATSTQCMCEECRKLDPVNAAPGAISVFFPTRKRIPYVAATDRVFFFMNRVAEIIEKTYPDMLLSCYAYSSYTVPPVKVKPHRNLLILSVAGYYNKYVGDEVEQNLAAWSGFGNKVMWRPNAHGGFYIPTPHNLGRRMFNDISLMEANGIFGVDYDTMYSHWCLMPLMYYAVCRAHFNPDHLDYDTIADDYCRQGFGAAAKPIRAYFDHLEAACTKAAQLNHAAPKPINWEQRVEASMRLPASTDFDLLDRCLAEARTLAGDDPTIAFRLRRLQFGNDLGRRVYDWRRKKLDAAALDQAHKFVTDYLEKDPAALRPDKAKKLFK